MSGKVSMSKRPLKRLTKLQAAYIAGIIDGEGCICVSRATGGKKRAGRSFLYRASIGVHMTNERVIRWLHKTTAVGTFTVSKPPTIRSNIGYRWQIWSKNSADLCKQILPYLIVKNEQAKAVIDFQGGRRHPGRSGLTKKEKKKQVDIYNRFRIMNKRGVENVIA